MSTIGWTNSINASSVLDKVQHVQQMQEEVAHAQAKAKAAEEERTRQTTVTETPDGEKLRLKEEEERKREQERRRRKRRSSGEEAGDRPDDGTGAEAERRIDIRV